MANLINEAEIRSTWTPIIESATGVTESSKLAWMSEYCHNHKLYEDANIMSLNPMNLSGMGAASLGATDGATGSGDKAPSLLPLAMQVAAQTIGLDLVPVVPMAGPMGLLSYLDFTYQGGSLDTAAAPTYVKVAAINTGADIAATANNALYTYVGESRIDGLSIYSVGTLVQANVKLDLAEVDASYVPTLVKALEDHVAGATGNADGTAYSREDGESNPDKVMGLSLYSKTITAKTFQIAAAVTREQVQDLKQFGVDAVAQVESVLANELTQSINGQILAKLRALAVVNQTNSGLTFAYAIPAQANWKGGETAASADRRILTEILSAANLIANRGRRGAGNFAVVGAQLASRIQSIAGFVASPIANTVSQAAGSIYPLGSVAGINIYTDPNQAWSNGDVLVGRKGDGNGTGLVFMPYLMAESVQTIAEATMAPKIAVKSRFALVEAGHHPETQYVKIAVTGL